MWSFCKFLVVFAASGNADATRASPSGFLVEQTRKRANKTARKVNLNLMANAKQTQLKGKVKFGRI